MEPSLAQASEGQDLRRNFTKHYLFEYCWNVLPPPKKKQKQKQNSVAKCNHVFVCTYVCSDVCVGICSFMCVLDVCVGTCVCRYVFVENREFTTLYFISQIPSRYF